MAGPYCSLILADMGAEVIKIESPPGRPDPYAAVTGEDEESPFFLSINRNKKSVVLDLHADEGRAVALDLIARADVVLRVSPPASWTASAWATRRCPQRT